MEKMNPLMRLLRTVCIMPSSPLEASSTADKTKRKVSPVILRRSMPAKMTAKMGEAARGCLG